MERAAPDTAGLGRRFGLSNPYDDIGPADHLLGGPTSKGEQHDAARVDASTDQASDMVGERLSFARAGSGYDKNRTVACRHSFLLLPIQIIQPGKFRLNAFCTIVHKIA